METTAAIPWCWPHQTGRTETCRGFRGKGQRCVRAAIWGRSEDGSPPAQQWSQTEVDTPGPEETWQSPSEKTVKIIHKLFYKKSSSSLHELRLSIQQHCESDHYYLILLIPAEVVPCGKLLRSLHHKVDEVPTAAEATGDQEVSQDSEEPAQVDVLVLLVLLLVHNGLLFLSKHEGNWLSVKHFFIIMSSSKPSNN